MKAGSRQPEFRLIRLWPRNGFSLGKMILSGFFGQLLAQAPR